MCRLVWLGLLLLAPPALAAPPLSFRLNAEAGPELDSNANRVNRSNDPDLISPITAPLFRLSGSGGLKLRLARHLLSLDYGGGAKVFFTEAARPADELVQWASAGWAVRAGQQGALSLAGSYYDAFQRESTRDFRTGSATLQLGTELLARLRATFEVGYRGLHYKPLPDYGFHGLLGSTGLSWRATSGDEDAAADWELRAAYAAGLRFFSGPIISLPERCSSLEQQFPCLEPGDRRDFHHQLRAEVAYLGNASASLGYTIDMVRSNSYGESFARHALGLRFTTSLLFDVFMTAKATLQLSRFRDPFLISQVSELSFASIDDENRSSLVVQFSRELGERWALLARWSLYVNESTVRGDQPHDSLVAATGFLRQTVFLGARFEYGR